MKQIFGGNWKLKLVKKQEIEQLLNDLKNIMAENNPSAEIFVAPPAIFIPMVAENVNGTQIKLAAQNVSEKVSGALTGEISVASLKEFNVEYVIIGHSERRHIFSETNESTNRKVLITLENGLKPVLCIGETAAERRNNMTEKVLIEQLDIGLQGVTGNQLEDIVIAYEPVWAINNPLLNKDETIRAATPKEAEQTHSFIRSHLVKKFGDVGKLLPLQYGGSMNADNAKELLQIPDINGGLIGTASLDATKFSKIFL